MGERVSQRIKMTYLEELEKERKEYAKKGDKASDMFLRGMKEGYLKGQEDTVDKILKMISSIHEFRLGCNCDWCILIHKITELQGKTK
jgi:flagellar biosynthesis/type III secretory pathway protein FliH